MASNTATCRDNWLRVLKESKKIADTISRLKKIRQRGSAINSEGELSHEDKKMIQKYLKSFNKCSTQDYEIQDEVGLLIKLSRMIILKVKQEFL